MPCYHPIRAWRSRDGRNASGAWPLVFDIKDGYADKEVIVPCGRCIGCRLDRSRDWAVRCMHESSMWPDNVFLTLTYDDAHMPDDGSLRKKDFQDFMKRLRKHFESRKIRFFHCGEYGGKLGRPHYHAIVFNLDFDDKYEYKLASDGSQLWISDTLNQIWGKGFCIIGAVTFESCAYVARYIMKKMTGEDSYLHYVDPDTGVIKSKEYVTMSRRPGIGGDWFQKYHSDVFPRGYVLSNGHPASPPRYYEKELDKLNHSAYLSYKDKLAKIARERKNNWDNTPDRLQMRENIALLNSQKLVRPLDSAIVQRYSSYVELAEEEGKGND